MRNDPHKLYLTGRRYLTNMWRLVATWDVTSIDVEDFMLSPTNHPTHSAQWHDLSHLPDEA